MCVRGLLTLSTYPGFIYGEWSHCISGTHAFSTSLFRDPDFKWVMIGTLKRETITAGRRPDKKTPPLWQRLLSERDDVDNPTASVSRRVVSGNGYHYCSERAIGR